MEAMGLDLALFLAKTDMHMSQHSKPFEHQNAEMYTHLLHHYIDDTSIILLAKNRARPSYPMGPVGPGPWPPSLRSPQATRALLFHLLKYRRTRKLEVALTAF